MIISASRRTDIPAFYSDWLMDKIRKGFCSTANPFNPNQITEISLKPEFVDVIVFWTKNANPLMMHLTELDDRGYKYYFQYTVNGYPELLEPKIPPIDECLSTFRELSNKIGPEKVIWRYDPIIFTNLTDTDYHLNKFEQIANNLAGYTNRVVVSIFDEYRGALARLSKLANKGVQVTQLPETDAFNTFSKRLFEIAKATNMEITSCAENKFDPSIIKPGKCIDNELIMKVFNIDVSNEKDKHQRAECGCVQSKDIGVYDTCQHGCVYCYARRGAAVDSLRAGLIP